MIRNIRWQAVLALLGSLLLIALLGHLAAGRTTVLIPAVGGRYIEALVGYPQQINPLLAQHGTPERDLCALVFSGLTRAEANGEMLPELAQSWQASEDGLTYTFHLRQDVRWHDGVPFTAHDVVFTVALIQSADFAGPPELAAAWEAIKTHAVDAFTVVFWLPQAYAPFLEQTALGLLPSHLLNDMSPAKVASHSFNQRPIGTGPFRLETLTAEYAQLVPHVQFYGSRPYLGQLEFRFYPSASDALSAYSLGEVMGVGQIPPTLLDRAASQPDLNLFASSLHGYVLVVLNNRHPILADKRVRQSLAYGTDRQALIDDVLNSQGIVIHSPIMPGHWAYEPDIPKHYPSIPRAEGLLDIAGWHRVEATPRLPADKPLEASPWQEDLRQKDGQLFAFSLLSSDDPIHQQLASALAGQWSRLGAQVTIKVVPTPLRDSQLYSYQFDAVLLEVALSADPDVYPWWHSTQADGGQNFAGFKNFAADEALQQARLVTERSKRWAFYRAFQQVFAEEVPAILLYQPVFIHGVSQKVRNVQQGPLLEPSHRFRQVHNWYLVTKRVIVQQPSTSIH